MTNQQFLIYFLSIPFIDTLFSITVLFLLYEYYVIKRRSQKEKKQKKSIEGINFNNESFGTQSLIGLMNGAGGGASIIVTDKKSFQT